MTEEQLSTEEEQWRKAVVGDFKWIKQRLDLDRSAIIFLLLIQALLMILIFVRGKP